MTRPHLKNLTWYVYRHFDKDGRALYVGCSHDPVARHKSHKFHHTWWAERIARTRVTVHKGYDAGRAEEMRSIKELRPVHNGEYYLMDPASWDKEFFLAYGYAQMEQPWADNFGPMTALGKVCRMYQDRFNRSLVEDVGPVPAGFRRDSKNDRAGKLRMVRPDRIRVRAAA